MARLLARMRPTRLAPLPRRGALVAACAVTLAGCGLAAVEVADAGVTPGPALSIDAAAGLQPISPYIYGIATFGLSVPLAEAMRVPLERWGGDAVTRYDWQYNTTNSGGDWFYIGGQQSGSETPSATPDADELKAQQSGGTMLMTIPMIPWIAGTAPTQCSFPTPPYPPQGWYGWAATLPDGARCGQDDSAPTIDWNWVDSDIAQNHVANSPTLQQSWVDHLVSSFGDAANGGVGIYEMDNEPSGWDNTHRDVFPDLLGWDQLLSYTEQYAGAVKTADPTAKVDGPGDFAWWVSGGPQGDNSASHGNISYEGEYYLQQIAAYQASPAWQSAHPGKRVIDYFDEHYYPSSPSGVSAIGLAPATDAANQQARLDSTCTLWEASCSVDGTTQKVGILPTMKSWIAQYDPGIPPAISEYDWGGHESLNGALAEADVLGILGAQGVGLASMWGVPTLLSNGDPQPVVFSFEMYRNYDGHGDGFGDTSVQATSGDASDDGASQLAVYGATRSSDGALTIMVINKTATDLTSPLSISGFPGATAAGATAQVYTYDADNLDAVVRQPDLSLSAGSATFPADSITLLVIPPSGAAGASAPSAPNVTGVSTSDAAATVSFSVPSSDGGSPVTSYTVTATDSSTGTTTVGYGSKSPVVVPGLVDGHSYTFSVAATNLAGTTSSTSSGTSSVPTTAPTTTTTLPVGPRVTTTTLSPPSTTVAESTTTAPATAGTSGSTTGGGLSATAASTSTSSPSPTASTTSLPIGLGSTASARRPKAATRGSSMAVFGVSPARVTVGSGPVVLSLTGRGFKLHERIAVRVSGNGVPTIKVRVLRSNLLSVRVRAMKYASPGTRSVVVSRGRLHATCRDCLVVRPSPRKRSSTRSRARARSG